MAFLTNDEKQRLRAQIEAVEQRTRGELVTVIARQSDPYAYIPLLWAGVIALSLPPLIALAGPWLAELRGAWNTTPDAVSVDLVVLSIIQLTVFLLLSLAFRWLPLKMRVIPKSVRLRRAARTAREQFLAQGVHNTGDRCGVLIFVSVAEHYVEILADRAINEKVDQAAWDAIVAAFVAAVKQGEVAAGFEQAVQACGDLLATHFPAAPDSRNELPDHLIEI
jgi:putative membrane protein